MVAVLSIGVILCLAGLVLLVNLFGAGDYVIRKVTAKSLGDLAPGYAASKRGFKVYATLLLAVGILCAGVGMTASFLPLAAGLLVIGAVTFGIASMVAIAGEIETYRMLKR